MSTMPSIKEHLSRSGWTQERVDKLVEIRTLEAQEKRKIGIERFGWDPSCDCELCGDTGINPEKDHVCWCDAGKVIALRKERESDWVKVAPPIHLNSKIETHPVQKAQAIAHKYIDDGFPNCFGLLISGPVGTGKTGVAVAIARELYLQGVSVRIGTFTQILDEMRPASGSNTTNPQTLLTPGLLVLDDLGTQKVTEYVAERLFAIVDGRYQQRRPTIITTNLTIAEIKSQFGERVSSRIFELSMLEVLPGDDLRLHQHRRSKP